MSEIKLRLKTRVKIVTNTGCWEWQGALTKNGYGQMKYGDKVRYVHCVSYEVFRKDSLSGRQIDHLCKNRKCVNPEHLEAVSARENVRRSNSPASINAKKQLCINGHRFSVDNTRVTKEGKRICKECNRTNARKYYWKYKKTNV